jgi:hypothetical protein
MEVFVLYDVFLLHVWNLYRILVTKKRGKVDSNIYGSERAVSAMEQPHRLV